MCVCVPQIARPRDPSVSEVRCVGAALATGSLGPAGLNKKYRALTTSLGVHLKNLTTTFGKLFCNCLWRTARKICTCPPKKSLSLALQKSLMYNEIVLVSCEQIELFRNVFVIMVSTTRHYTAWTVETSSLLKTKPGWDDDVEAQRAGTSPVSGSGGPASVGAGALICARSPLAVFVRAHAPAQRRAVPVTNGARAHCRRRSYTQHQCPAPLPQLSFLNRQRLPVITPRAPAIQLYYVEIRNFVIIFIQY